MGSRVSDLVYWGYRETKEKKTETTMMSYTGFRFDRFGYRLDGFRVCVGLGLGFEA